MTFILKLKLDGDIRRNRFDTVEQVNMEGIDGFIMENFGAKDFLAKYVDDEGDLCTLTAMTLTDALDLASPKGMLSLVLSTKEVPVPSAKEVPEEAQSHLCASEVGTGSSISRLSVPRDHEVRGRAWHGGGPKWLGFAFKLMSQHDCLRPDLATALLVQWLPIVKQRVIRKMEKVRLLGPSFVPQLAPALLALSESVEVSEKLHPFRERLCRLVSEPDAVDMGMLAASFLKTMDTEPFEIQCRIIEPLLAELFQIPLVQEKLREPMEHNRWMEQPGSLLHHGVVCDGCQASPIQGPRFKCTSCGDYDLCGTCYLKKGDLHDPDHAFETLLLPGKGSGKGWKGGKGKGKADWKKMAETDMAAWLEARGVESKQDATTAKIESDPSATGKDHESRQAKDHHLSCGDDWNQWSWGKGKKGKGWWKGNRSWWPEEDEGDDGFSCKATGEDGFAWGKGKGKGKWKGKGKKLLRALASAWHKEDEEDAQGNGEGEVQPCRKGCPWSKGKGKGKAWWAMAGHGGKPWQHDGFPYPWWMHVAPWHYGMDASVWDSFSDAFDDSASATVWIDADDGAVENP